MLFEDTCIVALYSQMNIYYSLVVSGLYLTKNVIHFGMWQSLPFDLNSFDYANENQVLFLNIDELCAHFT